MPPKAAGKKLRVAPLWVQPLRWGAVTSAALYYRIAYRIRGWGSLPRRRGATLIIGNHQHDLESAVIVATLTISSFSWRYPIFTVSSRRMWEPGFMAERLAWLSFALRTVNAGPMFSAIGLQPIENDLHSRPFVSLAYTLLQQHGDLELVTVFRERALERLPKSARMLSDLLKPKHFKVGRTLVTLSELREPYRRESLDATRAQINADLAHFEELQRDGASIWTTPEGFYSGDGRMQRLRGVLLRLAPLATIWITGISYDPFVGRRFSMLYRVVPSVAGVPLEAQIKRTRPVTTSALIATWLHEGPSSFTEGEAVDAVTSQVNNLPRDLFVDPDLLRNPKALVKAALAGMKRLGIVRYEEGRYHVADIRHHPQFRRTADIIAYQAAFHQETLDGATQVMAAEGQ